MQDDHAQNNQTVPAPPEAGPTPLILPSAGADPVGTGLSRRKFLAGAGGAVLGAVVVGGVPRLLVGPAPEAAAASAGPAGAWKDQIIMTIEWGKYAGFGSDAGLAGTNDATSDQIQRFEYSLDTEANQGNNRTGDPLTGPGWFGYGMLGGDLVGFDNHVAHIKGIGATTVVIYPVMQVDRRGFFLYMPTNYSGVDFKQLDPNARGPGVGPDDFTNYAKLISDLHDTSIGGYRVNVLQDLAMSAVGFEHPWFSAAEGINNVYYFRLWDANTYSNNVASGFVANDGTLSGPTTFEDSSVIDISSTFNLAAFTHSGEETTGNFDGQGNTYPAEPSGYGLYGAIGDNNTLAFELGEKLIGVNNATAGSASSDTIFELGMSHHQAGIVVALAAVGARQTVTFRVTYTDSTYTDTQAVIPTWDASDGGLAIDPITQGATMYQLASFPTMNTPSGPVSTPTYIYSLSLALDPTKVPTSVTLLASSGAASTRVLALSTLPLIVPARVNVTYNERGFTPEYPPGAANGNLNNSGLLFPIRPYPNSGDLTYVPTTLGATWPKPGPGVVPVTTLAPARFAVGPLQGSADNMVQARGQKLSFVAQHYHRFRIAAFATGSDQTATFQINYTDGSHDTATVTIKAMTDTPASGDIVVHTSDHALRYTNGTWQDDTSTKLSIFGYELAGDAAKLTDSVTLPDNPDVHLVGLNPLILIDNGDGAPLTDPTNGMSSDSGPYAYFLSVLAFWLTQGGADGYRIDSAQNYEPSYLKTMINDWYKVNYPNNWMLGEAAVAEPSNENPNSAPLAWQLRRWQYTNPADGVNFTGVYDFGLSDAIVNCFAKANGALDGKPYLKSWFWALIKQSIYWDGQFTDPWNQLAFFDFYENQPFLWETHEPWSYTFGLPLLRLAAAFLFSINRIPMLFSGNEYLTIYGAGADPGSNARRPGYLLSSELTSNPQAADNYAYMKTLVAMRQGSEALRSAEKMTNTNWVLQDDITFGFVRQGAGQIVVALFNNQNAAAGPVTVNLPSGVSGAEGTFNYILANSDGTYGGNDPAVTWSSASQARIAQMGAYEAKIIKVS